MQKGNSPNNSPGDTPKELNSADSFADAIANFKELESLLHGDDDSFSLPLRSVLKLFPEDYLTVEDLDEVPDESVTLRVDDLFYQLSKGKLEISCSELASFVPPSLIRPQALEDEHTVIRLPLHIVVKSIDPALLRDRTAVKASRHKAIDMPDPFARKPGAKEQPVASVPPQQEAPPAPTPAPESAPVEEEAVEPLAADTQPAFEEETLPPEQAAEAVEPILEDRPPVYEESAPASTETLPAEPAQSTPQAEEPVLEPEYAPVPEPPAPILSEAVQAEELPQPAMASAGEPEFEEIDSPSGVNLNSATKEQLLTLDGVTLTVAEAILSHREQYGPFASIFDVQDISRVGRKTFRKITGMPYSKARRHRRWKLAHLLRLNPDDAGRLPSIAQALTSRPGFSGCIISDRDGLLLAQSGAENCADPLSAVAPRLLQQLGENINILNMGILDCVSISVGSHMITMVASGKICLTAIHARNKLTKGQLSLVTKVADELAWLLSHRGYAGR